MTTPNDQTTPPELASFIRWGIDTLRVALHLARCDGSELPFPAARVLAAAVAEHQRLAEQSYVVAPGRDGLVLDCHALGLRVLHRAARIAAAGLTEAELVALAEKEAA